MQRDLKKEKERADSFYNKRMRTQNKRLTAVTLSATQSIIFFHSGLWKCFTHITEIQQNNFAIHDRRCQLMQFSYMQQNGMNESLSGQKVDYREFDLTKSWDSLVAQLPIKRIEDACHKKLPWAGRMNQRRRQFTQQFHIRKKKKNRKRRRVKSSYIKKATRIDFLK